MKNRKTSPKEQLASQSFGIIEKQRRQKYVKVAIDVREREVTKLFNMLNSILVYPWQEDLKVLPSGGDSEDGVWVIIFKTTMDQTLKLVEHAKSTLDWFAIDFS